MTQNGPGAAAACFDSGGGTKAWTNTGNGSGAADGVFTTMVTTTQTPNEIAFNQFSGFTSIAIPSGATINGIQVDIKAKVSNAGAFTDTNLSYTNGAFTTFNQNNQAFNSSTTFGTTNAVVTFGGPTSLGNPNTTWLPADFDSAFTVFFDIARTTTSSRTFSLDSCTCTIYYTVSGTNWTLTGTITGASSVTGAAGVKFGLTGTIAGASSVTGAAALNAGLTGAISGASALAGSIALAMPLNASIAAASAIAGTLYKDQPITGTISAASSVSGSVGINTAVTGTITAASAIAGTLLRTFSLSALITAVSDLSGTIVIALANAATVGATSDISGSLGVNLGLVGSISNDSSILGTLSVHKSDRAPGVLGDSNLCDLPP